jgi:deazaflavin-dependent oxidoreductase (nitroreductase family)
MKLLFAFEKFLVGRYGFSLVAWLLSRWTGLPPVPTLLLVTTGRKSGRTHEMPVFYFRDGENFVVIASKGGAPRHPAWFFNLQARPDALVRFAGKTIPVRARVATPEERSRLWAVAARAYPPYDDYQARAGSREIPVVVLERRG